MLRFLRCGQLRSCVRAQQRLSALEGLRACVATHPVEEIRAVVNACRRAGVDGAAVDELEQVR